MQSELFDFIKSMSKADKRFFRLFSEAIGGKGSKTYLELFDCLDRLAVYNEEEVKAQLGNSSLVRHFSTNKNRLLNQLLRAQRVQRAGRSVDSQLRQLLEDIDLLYQKGLFKNCEKRISKALQLALNYEKEQVVLNLLDWQWRIKQLQSIRKQEEAFSLQLEEQIACMERLNQQSELKQCFEQIRILGRLQPRARTEQVRAKYDGVLAHPALESPPDSSHFLASVFYYLTHAIYQMSFPRYTDAASYLRQLMHIWHTHEDQIQEYPELYLQTNHNYLSALLFGHTDMEEFQHTVLQLRQRANLSRAATANLTWVSYHHELIYAINFRSTPDTVALMQDISDWMDRSAPHLSTTRQLSFYHNFAMFHFARGEWSQTNRWLMSILQIPEGSERQDIRDFARLIQIFIQYQLGNFDLNEYLMRSTYRYMTRNKRYHEFERAIMKLIRRSVQATSKSEEQRYIDEFRKDLFSLMERHGQKSILGLDEMLFWTRAKTKGLSMAEMYRQNIETNRKLLQQKKKEESQVDS